MNIFEYNDEQKLLQNYEPSPAPALSPYDKMVQMQGGMLVNHPQGGSLTGQGEGTGVQEATMPGDPNGGMDVAGFANYGMQAPPLQDPMAQLKGLMSMSPQQPQQPRQQMPQGNLMSYLAQLGAF